MKRLLSFIVLFAVIFSFAGCDGSTISDTSDYTIDFSDATSFEKALNDGTTVMGEYVQFCVNKYAPNSILGINCHAGEHLNFIFEEGLDVKTGDIIIVRITEEPSKIFLLGSWEVPCEFVKFVSKNQESNVSYDSTLESTFESENMAEAPDDWINLLEKHYEEVKKLFEDAGFTNITCVAHEIDYNENNVFEGSVVNIAIGENREICIFEKGEQWSKDIKISIDYRVKPVKENSGDNASTDVSSQAQSNSNNSTDDSGVTVPKQEENTGNLVWVPTNGGTKYHSRSGCSGMKNPMQVSVETAELNGYTPCAKCH